MSEEQYPNAIILTSKDMKKSIAFYRDQLGFEVKEAWPDENQPQWCNLVFRRQSIMLGAAVDPKEVGKMCVGDPEAIAWYQSGAEDFQRNKPGVGVSFYLEAGEVDAYHDRLVSKKVSIATKPKDQFYGLRDFQLQDPDGYRLVFYKAITMKECQSCGMPLQNATPGQMYCQYCVDQGGKLRPFEQILEGTTTNYFMAIRKMPRAQAESEARKLLLGKPAWKNRAKEAHSGGP